MVVGTVLGGCMEKSIETHRMVAELALLAAGTRIPIELSCFRQSILQLSRCTDYSFDYLWSRFETQYRALLGEERSCGEF